jgi:hypothetical protein
MSLFEKHEDLQYFVEREKLAPIGKKEYCNVTIRLLSEAQLIYTGIKKQEKDK